MIVEAPKKLHISDIRNMYRLKKVFAHLKCVNNTPLFRTQNIEAISQ